MRDITAEEIVNTKDIETLLIIKSDLTKMLSNAHQSIHTSETQLDVTKAKGRIAELYALKEICESQIEIRKERIKLETGETIRGNNEVNRQNYHFRMSAKRLLSKKSYDLIMEYSKLRIKEMKQLTKGLKKNGELDGLELYDLDNINTDEA